MLFFTPYLFFSHSVNVKILVMRREEKKSDCLKTAILEKAEEVNSATSHFWIILYLYTDTHTQTHLYTHTYTGRVSEKRMKLRISRQKRNRENRIL